MKLVCENGGSETAIIIDRNILLFYFEGRTYNNFYEGDIFDVKKEEDSDKSY